MADRPFASRIVAARRRAVGPRGRQYSTATATRRRGDGAGPADPRPVASDSRRRESRRSLLSRITTSRIRDRQTCARGRPRVYKMSGRLCTVDFRGTRPHSFGNRASSFGAARAERPDPRSDRTTGTGFASERLRRSNADRAVSRVMDRSYRVVIASVRSPGPLHFVSHRERVFDAEHGIYRRTALKRCQRKGDRPRGGFRLPSGAVSDECLGWLGSGAVAPRSSDAVTEDLSTKHSHVFVAVGGVPFHELSPTLPRAGVAHQHEPYASDQLRRPQPGSARRPPPRRPLRELRADRRRPPSFGLEVDPPRRLSPRRLPRPRDRQQDARPRRRRSPPSGSSTS